MTTTATLTLKEQLLAKAAKKEPRHYTQLDGFANVPPGDCVMVPDSEGDCRMSCDVHELRSCDVTVRIQIEKGTSHETAVRLTKKLLNWLERAPHMLEDRTVAVGAILELDECEICFDARERSIPWRD